MAYHVLMPIVMINGKAIDLSPEEALRFLPDNIGIAFLGGLLTGNEHHPDGSIMHPGERRRKLFPASTRTESTLSEEQQNFIGKLFVLDYLRKSKKE